MHRENQILNPNKQGKNHEQKNIFKPSIRSLIIAALVIPLALGAIFPVSATTTNTVIGWGANYQGQITIPSDLTDVVAIAAGGSHSWRSKAIVQSLLGVKTIMARPPFHPALATWSLSLRAIPQSRAQRGCTVVGWGDNRWVRPPFHPA